MWRNICGLEMYDDIDWKNVDYGAVATIVATMVLFLVVTYMVVIL